MINKINEEAFLFLGLRSSKPEAFSIGVCLSELFKEEQHTESFTSGIFNALGRVPGEILGELEETENTPLELPESYEWVKTFRERLVAHKKGDWIRPINEGRWKLESVKSLLYTTVKNKEDFDFLEDFMSKGTTVSGVVSKLTTLSAPIILTSAVTLFGTGEDQFIPMLRSTMEEVFEEMFNQTNSKSKELLAKVDDEILITIAGVFGAVDFFEIIENSGKEIFYEDSYKISHYALTIKPVIVSFGLIIHDYKKATEEGYNTSKEEVLISLLDLIQHITDYSKNNNNMKDMEKDISQRMNQVKRILDNELNAFNPEDVMDIFGKKNKTYLN